MIKNYQITLFSTTGKYKPVSAIIQADTLRIAEQGKEKYIENIRVKGIQKICYTRYWSNADLKRYGYTRVKIREYDKEKIEKENLERYQRIKRERGWE